MSATIGVIDHTGADAVASHVAGGLAQRGALGQADDAEHGCVVCRLSLLMSKQGLGGAFARDYTGVA